MPKLGLDPRDGHPIPTKPPIKTVVDVPRKNGKGPNTKTHAKTTVWEWADGSGVVRVGKGTVDIIKGREDVSTWTTEELKRGAPMRVKRVPQLIPLIVYNELAKRLQSQVRNRFLRELELAVDKHMAIINNINPESEVVSATEWNAIKELYDRVLGKPEEHVVHHDADLPYKAMLARAIVGSLEQANEIIEGEVVEVGDDGSGGEDESEAAG